MIRFPCILLKGMESGRELREHRENLVFLYYLSYLDKLLYGVELMLIEIKFIFHFFYIFNFERKKLSYLGKNNGD